MEPETTKKSTSFARASRMATLLIALFSKRTQRSVTPRPPSLGWLFISCFQPAEWYCSFTWVNASGSYCQGCRKWYRWTETPLTPAMTRRRSSFSASSLEAKTSLEWSSVNSVFEDAICCRLLGVRHLGCQSGQDDCQKKAGQLHREDLDKSGGVMFERRTTSTLANKTPGS